MVLGSPASSRELQLMILMGPFQCEMSLCYIWNGNCKIQPAKTNSFCSFGHFKLVLSTQYEMPKSFRVRTINLRIGNETTLVGINHSTWSLLGVLSIWNAMGEGLTPYTLHKSPWTASLSEVWIKFGQNLKDLQLMGKHQVCYGLN